MATTTNSTAAAGVAVFEGQSYAVVCVPATLTVATNPTGADVVQMVKLPKGAIVIDVMAVASDMDTSGSPTLTFSVGYGDDTDYFISVSTVAQAGGVVRPTLATARPLTLTGEDTIDILWGTTAATFAAGTIDLMVYYVNP